MEGPSLNAPLRPFLKQLLALTIEMQNILFTAFEALLTLHTEGLIILNN